MDARVIRIDPRCFPLVELSREAISRMLWPVTSHAGLREVSRVGGGLVNTIYRISTGKADGVYGLRVYTKEDPAMEMECELLRNLSGKLPVPKVLFADGGAGRCASPYLVYGSKGLPLTNAAGRIPERLFSRSQSRLADFWGKWLAQLLTPIASAAVCESNVA